MKSKEDLLEDLKEDLLEDLEVVLKKLSGSERLVFAKEVIHEAAFWGSPSQAPIIGKVEGMVILQETITEWHKDYNAMEVLQQIILN